MSRMRYTLGPIAAAWLICQAAIVIVAPAVFWLASAEELLECTCTHGNQAMCPMHHKPAPGSKICLMRSADDRGAAVLNSLFGAAGLLPTGTPIAAPVAIQIVVRTDTTTPDLRPSPPEPPPPRA